jgi:hypothetical protein
MATTEKPRRTETSFDINPCGGTVDVKERIDVEGEDKGKIYSTVPILDVDCDDLQMGISVREDEDGIFLSLRGYHLQGEGEVRVFHSSIEVVLTIADIRRLNAFLGFLLASGIDGITNN